MFKKVFALVCVILMQLPRLACGESANANVLAVQEQKIVIGATLTLNSVVLAEQRRINVYFPPGFDASSKVALPVIYMPDGGMAEDFLHIAGLIQVCVSNGTMRPFLLVGIENTQRRRDLTGPTENSEDKKIAPVVGRSAAFRKFLRTELKPLISKRYRTTDESVIVGESLAGLFVVETYLLEPNLFARYIAIDPSLWWNDQFLIRNAKRQVQEKNSPTIFFATSSEKGMTDAVKRLVAALALNPNRNTLLELPKESHATIYHPAALLAFRALLAPSGPPR
jgi:predicted alpha/beta superfamily hydrolase